MASSMTCRRHRIAMEISIDRLGRVTATCLMCERRKQHRCIDCGIPLSGAGWRCADHRREAVRRNKRNWYYRHPDVKDRMRALWTQRTEAQRARHRETSRRWRLRNVVRIKLYKRKHRILGTNGYKTRELYLAAMKRQNAKPGRRAKTLSCTRRRRAQVRAEKEQAA